MNNFAMAVEAYDADREKARLQKKADIASWCIESYGVEPRSICLHKEYTSLMYRDVTKENIVERLMLMGNEPISVGKDSCTTVRPKQMFSKNLSVTFEDQIDWVLDLRVGKGFRSCEARLWRSHDMFGLIEINIDLAKHTHPTVWPSMSHERHGCEIIRTRTSPADIKCLAVLRLWSTPGSCHIRHLMDLPDDINQVFEGCNNG